MRQAYWTIFVFCLLAATSRAREIYVDNAAGNDENTGLHPRAVGDPTGPVRSVAKALRLAQAGDHVILAKNEVPYRECVSLMGTRHSGAAPEMPFVLDGHGATLDGSAPIPDDGWTHYRDNIFRFRPKRLIQAVLFYRGRSLAPLPLPQTAAYPPRLAAMEWCVIEGAVYFAVEPAKLPPDYKLSYAELPTGLTLYQVRQVIVRNLVIQGFQADGVSAAVGSRDVTLQNVTCTANGQSGACVGGAAQVAFDGCKLFGNGESQLMTLANSETHLFSSELANDTARAWVDRGGRVYWGPRRIEGGRKEIKGNGP